MPAGLVPDEETVRAEWHQAKQAAKPLLVTALIVGVVRLTTKI